MKDEVDKSMEEALRQLEKTEPKAVTVVKMAEANAERAARELIEAEQDEVREALKKAAETKPLDLSQIPGRWLLRQKEGDGCPGSDCAISCGIGCIAGCAIGGGALVGFGTAGGTVGGAGTVKALSVTVKTIS